MRWGAALAAAVALVLGLPVTAAAATRYVAEGGVDSPGCTDPGAPCASVQYAVGQAGSGDTIQIGPGLFVGSVKATQYLTFVGAGGGTLDNPGATVIRGEEGSNSEGSPALELLAGGVVRSLRAQGGRGAPSAEILGYRGGGGIVAESPAPGATSVQLDDVVAVGGNGGDGTTVPGPGGPGLGASSGPGAVDISINDSEFAGGIGVAGPGGIELDGNAASAEVRNSRISNQELSGPGIVLYEGATATLESVEVDSYKTGVLVYEGAVTIRRSRIQAAVTALELEATDELPATAKVTDSLLFSTQSPAANVISEGQQPSAALEAVASTLVGRGKSAVGVFRGSESGPATATLRNSIVRHIPLLPAIPVVDLQAVGGAINADSSSFTTVAAADGGSVTAPGSAGNIAGDPLFANAGKGNFNLQAASPLIDRGNPALAGPGELDLAGAPRSLDGNRDCAAVPDIGAYEVTGQGIACDPAPAISKFGITNKTFAPKGGKTKGAGASAKRKKVKRGTKFTYTLSEPAKVRITIERRKKPKKGKRAKFAKVTTLSAQEQSGRQSTPFSGRVKSRALKPGKYRATIVATDSAGQGSAPLQLSFKVVSG